MNCWVFAFSKIFYELKKLLVGFEVGSLCWQDKRTDHYVTQLHNSNIKGTASGLATGCIVWGFYTMQRKSCRLESNDVCLKVKWQKNPKQPVETWVEYDALYKGHSMNLADIDEIILWMFAYICIIKTLLYKSCKETVSISYSEMHATRSACGLARVKKTMTAASIRPWTISPVSLRAVPWNCRELSNYLWG